MIGGRTSLAANIPNFFPDLVVNGNRASPSPIKSKTLDSMTKKKNRHSSSSGSCDSDCSSYSSGVSPSPSRNNNKKRSLDNGTSSHHEKRLKMETTKELNVQLDTLSKNNQDLNRIIDTRVELKRVYDTHGDKLKELSDMEDKVASKKGLLDRSTMMIKENMDHLMELEAKETALLLRIDALKKEEVLFDKKKLEWDVMREKIASSFGFTKKGDL